MYTIIDSKDDIGVKNNG